MIDPQTLLNIGNIVMLLGTLLLIKAVLKNRKILKGYDVVGSLLTFGGMLSFDIFYVTIPNWFSLGIAMVTTAYWLLVIVYSIKNKLKNRTKKLCIEEY